VLVVVEMDVFNREIRGDKKLVTCGQPQDGAIIANAADHGLVAKCARHGPDVLDELAFPHGKGKYIKNNGLAAVPWLALCRACGAAMAFRAKNLKARKLPEIAVKVWWKAGW